MIDTGMVGKLRRGAGRHLYTFQAGESKSRRHQVRGGESQEAGRQEIKSGQSLGHEAVDTKKWQVERLYPEGTGEPQRGWEPRRRGANS